MASSDLNIAVAGPLDLVSGPLRSMPVDVAAGTYVVGEVLALTGNVYGKLAAGSEAASAAVMPYDVTFGAQTNIAVWIEGDFNEEKLVINGAALASVKTALRKVGIMARKWGAGVVAA